MSDGPLWPEPSVQACFGMALGRGDSWQSDYGQLLRLHAKVREEIQKEIQGFRSPYDPGADSPQSADNEQGSSASASARASNLEVKQQRLRPRMTIAEAVSDVSSDETEISSKEQAELGEGSSLLPAPVAAASPAETLRAEPGCDVDKGHSVPSSLGDCSAVVAAASPVAAVAAEENDGANLQSAACPSPSSSQVACSNIR